MTESDQELPMYRQTSCLSAIASLALFVGACDGVAGPPLSSGMRVEVQVSGGIAGVDYSFEIVGGERVVRGLHCTHLCDFDAGEILLPLSVAQVQALAADLEDTGLLEMDGANFGTQCCDDFHYVVSFSSGVRSATVEGDGQLLPTDLGVLVNRMVAMSQGTVPALVDQARVLTLPADGYSLGPVTVDGDILEAELSFGGGCERHEIDVVLRGPWLESFPVRADMEFSHEDNDDPCDAFLTQVRSFDLRPVRAAYLASYPSSQPGQTTLILRLADPEAPGGLREVEYLF